MYQCRLKYDSKVSYLSIGINYKILCLLIFIIPVFSLLVYSYFAMTRSASSDANSIIATGKKQILLKHGEACIILGYRTFLFGNYMQYTDRFCGSDLYWCRTLGFWTVYRSVAEVFDNLRLDQR